MGTDSTPKENNFLPRAGNRLEARTFCFSRHRESRVQIPGASPKRKKAHRFAFWVEDDD
jgi:hypothetical protein